MFTREYIKELPLPDEVTKKYNLNEVAFFDIETTGFDKTSDIIMLISLGYYMEDGKFIVKQYYAEYIEDEENIVSKFIEEIKPFGAWCSYNGIAFDEPYIKIKAKKYKLQGKLPEKHIDLYRLIKPYYTQFGIERCNLKTVEKYLGIERKDQIDGGLSAQLYKQYQYTNNDDIRDTIMLHNFEDVLNLPILFKLMYKIDTDPKVIREPGITPNQLQYIESLLKNNSIELKSDLKIITKKAAAKVIDSMLKGKINAEGIDFIIKDTY